MSKILLVDVDSKIPNLPLMKLATHHRMMGHDVELVRLRGGKSLLNLFSIDFTPKEVYASCIYPQNRAKALWVLQNYPKAIIGGSGYDLNSQLPEGIEHLCPHYRLYGTDYSMGFTSRGCPRKCPWCIVPQKEGNIRDHAPLHEFLRHDKLLLLDNNFLASPRCTENLKELIARKIKVSFNQGLDIRLLDQENARLLAHTRYYDGKFKRRTLYFSFDLPELTSNVIEGVRLLKRFGVKPWHLFFYMLTGYNTSFDQDMRRFEVLRALGVLPYVMRYNFRRDDRQLNKFARWVNAGGAGYRSCSWEDYRVPKRKA